MANQFNSRANDLLVKLLASERERAKLFAAVTHYLARDAILLGTCHHARETTGTKADDERSFGGLGVMIKEASESNTRGFRGGWVSSWALEKLVRGRGIRVARNKYADLLESLGFERAGRAGSPIKAEDGQRPILYRMPGVPDGYGAYEKAQGYKMTG
jgi:hypothetical protein